MTNFIIPDLSAIETNSKEIHEDIFDIYNKIYEWGDNEFFESDLYKDDPKLSQYERMFVRGFLYCLVAEKKLKVVANYGTTNYNRIRYKVI